MVWSLKERIGVDAVRACDASFLIEQGSFSELCVSVLWSIEVVVFALCGKRPEEESVGEERVGGWVGRVG